MQTDAPCLWGCQTGTFTSEQLKNEWEEKVVVKPAKNYLMVIVSPYILSYFSQCIETQEVTAAFPQKLHQLVFPVMWMGILI